MAAIAPALIVVSAGPTSQGKLPAPEHLKDWQQKKIPFLITARQGTTTCITDGKALRTRTFTNESFLLDEQGRMMPQEKQGGNSMEPDGRLRD